MRSSTRKAHSKPGSTRIIGGHGSRAIDNSADFHATFSAQFLQRYAELFQALAAPVQHVALLNSFTTVNDCEELGLVDKVCQSGPITCLSFPEQVTSYPPPPGCPYTQLKQYYWMDFASVLPPLLLGVQPHHVVLDMCAAPGGKSLVLAMQLLLGQQQQQQQEQHAAVQEGGDVEAAAVGESQQQGVLTAGLLQQLHISSETQPQEAAAAAAAAGADGTEELSPDQQQQQQQGPEPAAEPPTAAPEGAAASSNAQQPQQEPLSAPGWAAAAGDGSSSTAGSVGGQEHDGNDDEEPAAAAAAAAAAGGRGGSSAGRLVCNELDPVRRQRLSGVLSGFIPGSLRRRVRLAGQDAAKHWARFEGGLYDRVLLDAPCTSERHVVAAALEAGGVVSSSSWSREQCSNMAAQQLKLLLAGLRALKPGGRLVYSTCSIAKVENDDVVQHALQQSSAGSVVVVPVKDWDLLQLAGGEPTQHGMICLPDKAGWGPIYLCLLEKQL